MKKELQTERMKNYFLAAAKEIVCAEGITAVSTRTIAERAGYSYATIYNYFTDINELLLDVAELFMDECREFITHGLPEDKSGKKHIYAVSKLYSQYFVQYPSVFSLLFTQNITLSDGKTSVLEKAQTLFDSLFDEINEYNKPDFDQYKYALHGLLLFSLNRNNTMEYKSFLHKLNNLKL